MAMDPKETIIYAGVTFLFIMGIYTAFIGLYSMGVTWIVVAVFFLAIFKQVRRPMKGVRQRKFIIMACALALFALGLYSFFQGEILIGASWLVAGVLALLLVLMVKGFHDFNQP
ncbi:MAG TPA: hypothetical protein PKI66_02450 [Methanobacteriaceae archaeon]|jgi:heme exporter protein D|nr:hypothetical protein [Euryarchaeota archaeon]HNR25557.1 hypothetical protein [Methanobacteriaceae archaeon]